MGELQKGAWEVTKDAVKMIFQAMLGKWGS
jgi:hypothetical protein